MAYTIKNGQGTLGKNKRKQDERQPDITGKFMLNDKLYYISGWMHKTQEGRIWYSLSVREPDEAAQMDTNTGAGQANDPGF